VFSAHAATASSHLIGTSARDWITTSGTFAMGCGLRAMCRSAACAGIADNS
jgi:hypothetical protein